MARSKQELVEITDDIFYELQMFIAAARLIQSFDIKDRNSVDLLVMKNSLIESFAIHARVLLEFLYYDHKKFDSDTRAYEFFNDPNEWIAKHSKMDGLLKDTWDRVGQEIAHLTYYRLNKTFETKNWKVKEISIEILELFREFICMVPSDRLGNKLRDYVNNVL